MKHTTFKTVAVLAALAGLMAPQAQASTYYFDRVSSNASVDVANQFSVNVADIGSGATFTFYNNVGIASSITDIYFDDATPALLGNFRIDAVSDAGVAFTSGATPANLPAGGSFLASYSADSDSPVSKMGVNKSTEWVRFAADYLGSGSLSGLIGALDAGAFKIGLHVQAIGTEGNSDSFVSTSVVPLPAAAWLFGSALFGFIMVSNRQKV